MKGESVQFSRSVVSSTLWPHRLQHVRLPLSIINSWSLLKLMSFTSVMPSNHLIPCHPFLFPSSIFPSIRVISYKSVLCIKWPKYWSFSFNISPSNEYLGLISFTMDWLDLPAVQGTLKSLLQHHSSKASLLQCSAFFTVQLSHPYMTTGKTIALTRRTFVGKVVSLLFNMLSSSKVKWEEMYIDTIADICDNTLATRCKELTHWKRADAGKAWRQEEKGMT